MARRQLTRIELKMDDLQEYEAIKRQQDKRKLDNMDNITIGSTSITSFKNRNKEMIQERIGYNPAPRHPQWLASLLLVIQANLWFPFGTTKKGGQVRSGVRTECEQIGYQPYVTNIQSTNWAINTVCLLGSGTLFDIILFNLGLLPLFVYSDFRLVFSDGLLDFRL